MTEIVNILKVPQAIEVDFTWTPSSHNFSYNGVTVRAASPNTAITFTATTMIDNDPTGELSIVEYRWDFGDGTQGYGNPIVQTYVVPNFQIFAVLRVQDNEGNFWYARHQMYVS